MRIRNAVIKDVPMIVDLWKELFLYHKKLPKSNKIKIHQELKSGAEDIFAQWVRKNIRSKNSAVLVAETNKKIVGYCLIYTKLNIPVFKIGELGHISDLYIKKDYRDIGIGSKFQIEAFKWFRKKGIKHVSLLVDAKNNGAHKFYKNHGFSDLYIEMRGDV